jgi:hypothetical protein
VRKPAVKVVDDPEVWFWREFERRLRDVMQHDPLIVESVARAKLEAKLDERAKWLGEATYERNRAADGFYESAAMLSTLLSWRYLTLVCDALDREHVPDALKAWTNGIWEHAEIVAAKRFPDRPWIRGRDHWERVFEAAKP